MTETTEDTQADEVEVVQPYESEGARRLRLRAAAKEEAAVTMAAEAKAAQRAKAKRLGKAIGIEGLDEFNKRAAEIEKSINKSASTKEG